MKTSKKEQARAAAEHAAISAVAVRMLAEKQVIDFPALIKEAKALIESVDWERLDFGQQFWLQRFPRDMEFAAMMISQSLRRLHEDYDEFKQRIEAIKADQTPKQIESAE